MKLNNENIAAIGKLFEEGYTISQIAKMVNASYPTAKKAVRLYQEEIQLEEDTSTEDPEDAIDCQGYRLTPDCAKRLLEIKKLNGYIID